MTTTTKTTTPSVFELLSKVKGIGPATIAKLQTAELDSVETIMSVGLQGLAAIAISDKTAKLVIDALPEAPASKPAPKKKVAKKPAPLNVMELAFAAAAAKKGTTVTEIRETLEEAPAPKPAPVVETKPEAEVTIISIDVTGHVAEGETTVTITNPLQLRPFAEQLNFELPKNVKGFDGLTFVDPAGKTVVFDKAWIIQVVLKNGATRFTIVDGEDIELSYKTVKAAMEPKGASVKKMWLSKAIARLFSIFRDKAAEEKAAAAAALLEEQRGDIVPQLVRMIGSNPRGQYWLTEEQVANAENPLSLSRVDSLIEETFRAEMGLEPTRDQANRFGRNLEYFMTEYQRRLKTRAPRINSGDDHRELVRGIQGYAGQADRYPKAPFVLVWANFRSINEVRYLVVHEDLLQAFRDEFTNKFQIRLNSFDLLLEWIGVRGHKLVAEAKEAIVAKEAEEFASSAKGKALLDTFAADPEEDVDEAGGIVL